MSIYKLGAGISAFILGVAVVVAVPGFTPHVEASLIPAAKTSERLDSRTSDTGCLQEPWPFGCQWRATTDTGCQKLPWPYGCDWQATTKPRAGRQGIAENSSGASPARRQFHMRRVHGVLTKVRVARRDINRAQ
jgi:hypothetical protein